MEAKGCRNGIGLVKLMGRDSGFIAAYATVASPVVNFCLVPEEPFTLDGPNGLLAALEIPSGYRLDMASDTTWRIVTAADGCLYVSANTIYPADSVADGPDRDTGKKETLPVAYSGDDWVGDAAKAATLTFVSPEGAETVVERTGTGAVEFYFNKLGSWTVRLEMADGTTRTAILNVIRMGGFVLSFR